MTNTTQKITVEDIAKQFNMTEVEFFKGAFAHVYLTDKDFQKKVNDMYYAKSTEIAK